MEQFDTLDKAMSLFATKGCAGNENCCFVTYKDTQRAESGFVGGMNYPYDGILINKMENGIGMIPLKFKKLLLMKASVDMLELSDAPYIFIPNNDIREITVKNSALINKKTKSIIIKTVDKKHCLLANIDEPKIPYHNSNLAQFISQYGK